MPSALSPRCMPACLRVCLPLLSSIVTLSWWSCWWEPTTPMLSLRSIYQHTLSTHPINTIPLLVHPIDLPYQHTLSTSYRYILTEPVSTQHIGKPFHTIHSLCHSVTITGARRTGTTSACWTSGDGRLSAQRGCLLVYQYQDTTTRSWPLLITLVYNEDYWLHLLIED